jgi:hypothetical protein
MSGCGRIVGILLVVIPVLIFQINPSTPLGRSWADGDYCKFCTVLGGIGGLLMARREDNALGFLWAAGMFGGAITAYLAYYASVEWIRFQNETDVNVFIIMICSIPGLIVFACIKRCSDYTFPMNYASIPDGPTNFSRRSGALTA